MTLYAYMDYKAYFNDRLNELPKGGRGEYRKLADALGVSTTMVSQVFKGDKHLSLELALEVSEYMGLGEDESDYYLLLVELARAGSFKLAEKLKKQIRKRQQIARQLDGKVSRDLELSADSKAVFYSNWIYSGIRNLVAIDDKNDIQQIANHLKLPTAQVQQIVHFLVENGLCVAKRKKIEIGPAKTYLPPDSPLVSLHHKNWRIKGFQEMLSRSEDQFFFTSPMSLSKEAALQIRQRLPEVIKEISKVVVDSPSEEVRCLNIDWFSY